MGDTHVSVLVSVWFSFWYTYLDVTRPNSKRWGDHHPKRWQISPTCLNSSRTIAIFDLACQQIKRSLWTLLSWFSPTTRLTLTNHFSLESPLINLKLTVVDSKCPINTGGLVWKNSPVPDQQILPKDRKQMEWTNA